MQLELLGAVRTVFDKNYVVWNPSWEILYIHVLDQTVGATRFRMHRDVEEDSNQYGKGHRLRVMHTVVLLLDKGTGKKVPGLYVAGADKHATYPKEMVGHVFNASLYHTTEIVKDGDSSGVKVGVFIGYRF